MATLAEVLQEQYPGALYVEIGQLIFIWSGGAYIDIYIRYDIDEVGISYECINVWDYETGKTTIPFTPEALIDEATEWIDA